MSSSLTTRRGLFRDLLAPSRVESGVPLTEGDARAIITRALSASKATSARVVIRATDRAFVRFAANEITTAGGSNDVSVEIHSAIGNRHASVTTNDLGAEGLRQAVAASEALARVSPEDPESLPPLGPQRYEVPEAAFDSTATMSADARAAAAAAAIVPARAAGDITVAGIVERTTSATAIGDSAGLFAYFPRTVGRMTCTARTADGTGAGWAGAEANDWSTVDPASVARRAIDKARFSRNPVGVEPGHYAVILEPRAVADLIELMFPYFDARSADEGRSPYSRAGGGTKIGDRVADSRVTIVTDPRDPSLRSPPFDDEGLPFGRQLIIEQGVLRQLYRSRWFARSQQQPPTGAPSALRLEGGSASVDDMVRATPRGILVTRFWYLREVDRRTGVHTGLTRDGTFLVENGRIAKSIRNLRFNDSPVSMLANVDMVGRAERVAGTDGPSDLVMPALRVRDFLFTSLRGRVATAGSGRNLSPTRRSTGGAAECFHSSSGDFTMAAMKRGARKGAAKKGGARKGAAKRGGARKGAAKKRGGARKGGARKGAAKKRGGARKGR